MMRHLRWTNDFAPHVGDMLEWATSAEGGLVLIALVKTLLTCLKITGT